MKNLIANIGLIVLSIFVFSAVVYGNMGEDFEACGDQGHYTSDTTDTSYYGSMMGSAFSGMYGFGLFGFLFWLIILGLIIWIVYTLAQRPRYSRDSLQILKERYAKGEISKKEFDKLKKDLGE